MGQQSVQLGERSGVMHRCEYLRPLCDLAIVHLLCDILCLMHARIAILDQYFRHQQVLKLLPGEARALDVGTIRERLEAQGIEVDKRTVQRDLNYLSRRFSVRSKPKPRGGKAKIWWTDEVLPQFCLSPTDAMNLVMLMEHAKRFGMAEQVKNLGVLDNYARSLLSEQRPAED